MTREHPVSVAYKKNESFQLAFIISILRLCRPVDRMWLTVRSHRPFSVVGFLVDGYVNSIDFPGGGYEGRKSS